MCRVYNLLKFHFPSSDSEQTQPRRPCWARSTNSWALKLFPTLNFSCSTTFHPKRYQMTTKWRRRKFKPPLDHALYGLWPNVFSFFWHSPRNAGSIVEKRIRLTASTITSKNSWTHLKIAVNLLLTENSTVKQYFPKFGVKANYFACFNFNFQEKKTPENGLFENKRSSKSQPNSTKPVYFHHYFPVHLRTSKFRQLQT